MQIDTLLKIAKYKIDSSEKYEWDCFGPDARFLDFKTASLKIQIVSIFDTESLQVYSMELYDYEKENYYRWIHPDFEAAVRAEHAEKDFDFQIAFDDVKYTDIILEDMVEKITAVCNGTEYDKRIIVPLTLPTESFEILERLAAEADMTVDDLVASVLKSTIYKEVLDSESKI